MKRMHKLGIRSAVGIGAVLALTVTLSACGGTPDAATTPSPTSTSTFKQGGDSLTVYTSEVLPYSQAIDPTFEASTGNTVTTAPRVVAADLLQRVDAEEQAGAVGADVLQIVDQTIWHAHPEWFVDLSKAGLPNYDSYPASAKPNPYCVDDLVVTGGFVYNTSLVDPAHAPKTWKDLLSPYWKGHVIMTDPRASGPYMSWAILMKKTFGTSFLTKLAAQRPALSSSASTAAQQVAAGAYWVNVEGFPSNSSDLIKAGAPLKFVVGAGPSTGHATCVGIFKGTKNLQAAKSYVNFMMSPLAQSAGCVAIPAISPLGKIPNCATTPKGWKASPLDPTTGNFVGVGDPAVQGPVLKALGLQ